MLPTETKYKVMPKPKGKKEKIMTNTRINSAINEAKNIINALMESEEIFYDRTEGNV